MIFDKQQGFLLFELILIISIASLVAAWSATRWANEMDDYASESLGVWLAKIKDAVDRRLLKDTKQVFNLTNLLKEGFLPTGFADNTTLPYELVINIKDQGVAQCDADKCIRQALTLLIPRPEEYEKARNSNRLGKMMAALAGQGLVVHPLSPARLRGPLADLPNPPWPGLPMLPVGTLATLSVSHSVTSNFGGAYVSPDSGNCDRLQFLSEWVNPVTGKCSCPPGYRSRMISEWKTAPRHDHFGSAEVLRGYICVAPL